MSAFLYRLARACFHHRLRVVAAWLVLLAAFGTLALTVGGAFNDTFTVPGASSSDALQSMEVTFPEVADASASIVIGAPAGEKVTDPAVRAAMDTYLADLGELPFVKGTTSPYQDAIKGLVSDNGSHAIVRVRVQGTASTFTDAQRAQLTQAAQTFTTLVPGSTVNVGGDVFAVNMPHISVVELLGVVVAIIVLVVTLGGLLAAVMPIVSAACGVGLGVSLVVIAAGMMDVNSTTLMLVFMLAMAVGIDYALFIISRHRDQLASGMDVEESAARAVATSGSAVCFAGGTVVIALVGLSIANLPFLTVMGVFAAAGVALEVCLALTLLPALFGLAGEHLRPKKGRALLAAAGAAEGSSASDLGAVVGSSAPDTQQAAVKPHLMERLSKGWVGIVTKKPLITILVVVIGMGSLALPARGLEMGLPNSGRSTPGAADRVTFDLITQEFGVGFNGPLIVTGSLVEEDDPTGVLDDVKADIEKLPGVAMVAAATPNPNVDTAMIQVIPTTGPDDPGTFQLVEALRAQHDTWIDRYQFDTAVTGLTAAEIDVTARLNQALLPFGIFVVGLSLILLLLAFRSIWVPIKAALGYLLSIGAAFGLTSLVFNQGVGMELINLPEPGPIISFLPIILMGILFGLSMDYEVFLTSRMREEYVHGNHDTWVQTGFVHSAKVVVAAACIMFSVFAFFVPAGVGVIKPIAFALAVGVAMDAFLVRMTLSPAVMKLMGEHAWHLPGWLERHLPFLDIEGEALAHQTRFADWPSPDDRSTVYARGLRAVADGQVLFDGVDLTLAPGDVLVVTGDKLPRFALVYGLSGRATFNGGEAKVLGRVLPEEAALVRSSAPVILPSSREVARELRRGAGGLIVVPAADELPDASAIVLRETLAGAADIQSGGDPAPTAWVLGVASATDPATVAPPGHLVYDLASAKADFALEAL